LALLLHQHRHVGSWAAFDGRHDRSAVRHCCIRASWPYSLHPKTSAFYDDSEVFATYMQHRAWSANPNDTIERPAFLDVLGDVRGRRVLDLGCGDGRFGRNLLDAGALSYLGVDASANRAALADQTLPGCVRHQRIEEFTAPPGSMELVVSRLALHYVSDVGAVLRRVYTTLADSGRLVFSVEHPVITSSDQAWQGRGPPGMAGRRLFRHGSKRDRLDGLARSEVPPHGGGLRFADPVGRAPAGDAARTSTGT